MKWQHLYIDYPESPNMETEIDYSLLTPEEIKNHRREKKIEMLKEKFAEKDFLLCDKTRVILEEEHIEEFEKKCVPNIDNVYNYHHNTMHGLCATPLYYDIHNEFSAKLHGIVYNNIIKKYNLQTFYDNPDLANPLIAKTNAVLESTKKSPIISVDVNKKFDWGIKTLNKKKH